MSPPSFMQKGSKKATSPERKKKEDDAAQGRKGFPVAGLMS